MTYSIKTKLWPHQEAMRSFALSKTPTRGCALFAAEMRTGKSLTALSVMATAQAERALIIAPTVPATVWMQQFERHMDGDYPAPILLHRGSVPDRIELLRQHWIKHKGRIAAIINYEALARMPELLKCQWPLLILDECHRGKGPTSKVSKILREKLRQQATMRLGLSGTPLPQGLVDAFGVYSAISRDVFGLDYWTHFKRRYAIDHPRIKHAILDWRDKDLLIEAMKRWTISCKMEDVLPGYKAPTDEWLWVDLEPKTQKAYADLERDMIAQIEKGIITVGNALTKCLRLQQLAGGVAVTTGDFDETTQHRISSEKLTALAGLMEDVPAAEPLGVFAQFTADLDGMIPITAALKRPLFFVRGGMNQEAEFHQSAARGEGPIIALQIQAGSEGIDLSEIRLAYFLGVGYSSSRYRQARARFQGPNQKRDVTLWHLGAKGTIDKAVFDALENKKEFEDEVLRYMRITRDVAPNRGILGSF